MLDLVKPVVDMVQEMLEERIRRLGDAVSTCSHEFIEVLDELERAIDERMAAVGRRVDLPGRGEDLVIAAYLVENVVVEIGIRGFNRCAPIGVLAERAGGVRVYARLHAPGAGVIGEVEAEARERRATEATRYIY